MITDTLHDLHRPLGLTGLSVSPLGLGTVKLGRDQGVKYPSGFTIPGDSEAKKLLDLAVDLGINLIDTAPAYGNSEERLGRLLAAKRQHWVIVTKFGEEFENGQSHFDFSPGHARFSLERSLRRLRTDYLDVLLIHSDGNDKGIMADPALLQQLQDFKRQGLIRAFGLSGKTPEGGIIGLQQADCAMVAYNLQNQAERPVLDYAAQQHTGVFIKKALASGHACPPGKENACDPVKSSFELVFSHPAATSAIIGTINPEHLRRNVETAAQILKHRGNE